MSDRITISDKDQVSKKWRHAGVLLDVTTILSEGEELAPFIDWIKAAFEAKGLDVRVMHSGERPAFRWEVPYEENDQPENGAEESDYG